MLVSADSCAKLVPGEVRALTPVRSVRQARAETPVSVHLCPVHRFYDKLLQDVTDATVRLSVCPGDMTEHFPI